MNGKAHAAISFTNNAAAAAVNIRSNSHGN
jgi:hypothetical protein